MNDFIDITFKIIAVIAIIVSIPVICFIWANPRPPRK